MIVTCPACATRYLVDPAALGPEGRMVRCARCTDTWFQAPPPSEPAPVDFVLPEPVMTPPPAADGSPAVPTEPMPSFIGSRDRLDRPKLPALRKPPPLITTVQIGWAVLIVVVVTLMVTLFGFHDQIAAAWPPSQRLYNLVGLVSPGPDNWFQLREAKTAYTEADGQRSQVVSGEIANISPAPHPVPKLRLTLQDAHGKFIKTVDFQPPGDALAPGQTLPFQTSVATPDGTTKVSLSWALN